MTSTLTTALTLLLVAAPLAAKGRTVKIVIAGGTLEAPIEVTGAKAGRFHIWEGPGVFVNGVEQTEGFIVNWSRGTAQPPKGMEKVTVSFYTGCDRSEYGCNSEQPQLAYVVTYGWRPGTQEAGFVYIPGPGDEEAKHNRMTHGAGYEGHWLRATAEWDEVVLPLLAKSR